MSRKKSFKYLEHFCFDLTYEENKVAINQNQFFKEYDNGLSFIDYLYEFYCVRDIYKNSYSTKIEESYLPNSKIKKSDKRYYHGLLFIKWFFTELKNNLNTLYGIKHKRAVLVRVKLEDEIRIWIGPDFRIQYGVTASLGKIIAMWRYIPDGLDKIILLYIIMRLLLNKESDIDIKRLDSFLEIMEDDLYVLLEEFRNFVSLEFEQEQIIKYIYKEKKITTWFEKIINNKKIIKELESLSGRQKNKLNCYAEAVVNGEKYYSINGLDGDDYKLIHNIFTEFHSPEYKSVFITNGVRYFLEDETEYITYGQFVAHEQQYKENRMFTCCERKLFAEIRRQKKINNDIQIIVTNQPCVYCSREINNIEKNYTNKIMIEQPEKDSNIKKPDCWIVKMHDSLAEEIWGNKNYL
jgi:hypothetical protein